MKRKFVDVGADIEAKIATHVMSIIRTNAERRQNFAKVMRQLDYLFETLWMYTDIIWQCLECKGCRFCKPTLRYLKTFIRSANKKSF